MRPQIRRLTREHINSAFDWYYGKDVDAAARLADEGDRVRVACGGCGRIAPVQQANLVVHGGRGVSAGWLARPARAVLAN